MKIINLFGKHKSKGTFDDFFDIKKYSSIEDAWNKNDYVIGNYVQDENGILFMEFYHVKNLDTKKLHRLLVQNPFAGVDMVDDNMGYNLAISML